LQGEEDADVPAELVQNDGGLDMDVLLEAFADDDLVDDLDPPAILNRYDYDLLQANPRDPLHRRYRERECIILTPPPAPPNTRTPLPFPGFLFP
jgi:hypothetical protein